MCPTAVAHSCASRSPRTCKLGAYTRRDRAAVAADLERIHGYFPVLAERRAQQAGTLSGGEQQMLAIARALMLRPRLLLLDEPSFGLAPLVVRDIFAHPRRINRDDGVSILLVEQNAELALDLASEAHLLETGRVVMSGPAALCLRADAAIPPRLPRLLSRDSPRPRAALAGRLLCRQASSHPRQDLLQGREEPLPPALGALVVLRLLRPEARLLHAQVRHRARRRESK